MSWRVGLMLDAAVFVGYVGVLLGLTALGMWAWSVQVERRRGRRLVRQAEWATRVAALQDRADDRTDVWPDEMPPADHPGWDRLMAAIDEELLPLSRHDRWWVGESGLDLDAEAVEHS